VKIFRNKKYINIFKTKNKGENGIVLITLLVFITIILVTLVTILYINSNNLNLNINNKNSVIVKSKLESAADDAILKLLRDPEYYSEQSSLIVDGYNLNISTYKENDIYQVVVSTSNSNNFHILETYFSYTNNKIVVQDYKIL